MNKASMTEVVDFLSVMATAQARANDSLVELIGKLTHRQIKLEDQLRELQAEVRQLRGTR